MSQATTPYISVLAFTEGAFSSIDADMVPRWAMPALGMPDTLDSIVHAIGMNGGTLIESYGSDLEGLDIFAYSGTHGPQWCALYWTDNRPTAAVVIHGAADFLAFQVCAAPLAQKIMQAPA